MSTECIDAQNEEITEDFTSVIDYYNNPSIKFTLEQFLAQVKAFFELNPELNSQPLPIVHSIKSRIKNPDHLLDKLNRKKEKGVMVTPESLFNEITDLIGVRILHLYQEQFNIIHCEIIKKIRSGDWVLGEDPKAYTWDPEAQHYFDSLGITTEIKDSYYTSVHYLVKPNHTSGICCEIQVRTLFEEVWGEIDHSINYPHKTNSIACIEQLKVLSRLVSTGTRLTDSIFRSYKEHIERQDESGK